MADYTENTEKVDAVEPDAPEASAPAASDVPVPAVTAQEAKVVGDDNLEVREPTANVFQEQVAAQVVQPREGDTDKVNVHEVSVQMDTVITDPSSPLAVQIPDAGRGSLDLPIHGLDAERPEDFFAREASKSDDE